MVLKGVDTGSLERAMEDVIRVSRAIFQEGLVRSTFGVVSERVAGTDYVVITPTGFRKGEIVRERLVVVDLDGNVVLGELKPSSETPMHTYVHRNVEGAVCVVHTHSPMATVFSILGREIPCLTSEQAIIFGGRIPVAKRYSHPGTRNPEELESIAEALRTCRAALLPRHGVIVYGETADEALDNAVLVEELAASAVYAMMIGEPDELAEEEIEYLRSLRRRGYGRRIG